MCASSPSPIILDSRSRGSVRIFRRNRPKNVIIFLSFYLYKKNCTGFWTGRQKRPEIPRGIKIARKNRKTGSIRPDRQEQTAGKCSRSLVPANFPERPQVAASGRYHGDRILHGIAGPFPTKTRNARHRFILYMSGPDVAVKTGILFDPDIQSHDQSLYLPTGSHGESFLPLFTGST